MQADSNCKNLENIHIGDKVKIQRKRTEIILEGIITDIFDDELFNDNGVDVEIDDCFQGNVKNIIHGSDYLSSEFLLKKIEKHESKDF